MRFRSVFVLFVSVTAGCLSGCGGDPLNYETAMNLLRERATDPVRTSFSASPRFETQDPKVSQAYQRLQDAHVIQCKTSAGVGTICEPGPAGEAITQSGVAGLSLVAGRWAPSAVVRKRPAGGGEAGGGVGPVFLSRTVFYEIGEAFRSI